MLACPLGGPYNPPVGSSIEAGTPGSRAFRGSILGRLTR